MRKTFLYITILSLGFASCKTHKATTDLTEDELMVAQLEAKADTQFQRKFFDAEKEKAMGNLDKALTLYYAALEIKDYPDLHHQIARLEAQQNNTEAALNQAKIAYDADPTNAWYADLMGELNEYSGKYVDAAKYYRQAGKLELGNFDRHFKAVQMYVQANDLDEAIKVIEDIEKISGLTEDTATQKQAIYFRMNKPDKALQVIELLVKNNPSNPSYKLTLCDAYFGMGEEEKGLKLLKELEIENPESGAVQMRLFDYYLQQEDKAKAQAALLNAIASDDMPYDEKVNVVIARISSAEGMVDSDGFTQDLLVQLRDTHPSESRSHSLSGDWAISKRETKDALEHYNRAVDLNPNQNTFWKTLISLQLEEGQYDALKKSTSDALERYPTDPDFYFLKGIGELRSGNANGAVTWLETGIEYVVSDLQLMARFYSALGEAHNEAKQFAKSDESFDKALEINPRDVGVKNNFAYFLSVRGAKLDKASELVQSALNLEPNSPTYLDTYAWVLYKQGKADEALVQIEKAISNGGGESGEVQEHYGDILFELGMKTEALKAYKKAQELGDASYQIDQKIENAGK